MLDNDPDDSVRYGAIRSVIELAARADPELRNDVSEEVSARATPISEQPKISGELRRCLLVDANLVTPAWLSFVAEVVRSLFLAVDNTNERDLWRRCLGEAERLYGRNGEEERRGDGPGGGRDG